MSEMVERVARAIYEGRNGIRCMSWRLLTKSHREPYQDDARAAIEAMREPTSHMLHAGTLAAMKDQKGVQSVYTIMISTALPQEGGER